jgi:hypothetical protein
MSRSRRAGKTTENKESRFHQHFIGLTVTLPLSGGKDFEVRSRSAISTDSTSYALFARTHHEKCLSTKRDESWNCLRYRTTLDSSTWSVRGNHPEISADIYRSPRYLSDSAGVVVGIELFSRSRASECEGIQGRDWDLTCVSGERR